MCRMSLGKVLMNNCITHFISIFEHIINKYGDKSQDMSDLHSIYKNMIINSNENKKQIVFDFFTVQAVGYLEAVRNIFTAIKFVAINSYENIEEMKIFLACTEKIFFEYSDSQIRKLSIRI